MSPTLLAAILLAAASCPLVAQVVDSQPGATALDQTDVSAPSCTVVLTARDAANCIGSIRISKPVPRLDSRKVYALPDLIDIAENASPQGRIAWTEAKRALERAGVERALYLPLLTFAMQGSDTRVIVPFPKPIAPRGYVIVEEPLAQAQLELQYTLLDFARKSRLEGSRALEIASTLLLNRVHQTIAFNTAIQFYRAQQALGQLEAAKTILQTAETLRQNAQSQYDHGRATLPDVQNADAGAAEAQFDLADAQGEAEKAKLALTETAGVEPTAEIQITPQDTESAAEPFEANVENLLRIAWKSRPDLLARAEDLRSARDSYQAAHASYLPIIGFTTAGGETSLWPTADFGQLGHASVSTWSVAAQLRWDIFNGARRSQIASALAEQQSASERQRETLDAVTRQVWEAYVDYQTALEQERASHSFLTAAQTSYDSSLEAFNYCVRSLVDVVQAERQLALARQQAVRARARRSQSEVALSYATGSLLRNAPPPAGVHP
jgi:outer membrane protein